jgi:hypothetical protein
MSSNAYPIIRWQDHGEEFQALWYSEAGVEPPKKIVIADDTMKADVAYRLATEGVGLLWSGDYQNARHLLQALARRADRKPREGSGKKPNSPKEAFQKHRLDQGKRAGILGSVLIPLDAQYQIKLRRGQEVALACEQVLGQIDTDLVMPLKGLLALVSAFEWRKTGIKVAALGSEIYPHFGVFSPIRGEYLDLLMKAPLPGNCKVAFDIGTGSGILAALLAKRGIEEVIATDSDMRSISCAQENIHRLGFDGQVKILQADLFPDDGSIKADLIVCNPPWIPAQPSSPIEYAIYDPDSQMLQSFLSQASQRMSAHGEVWLIISDIAEHLGLRTREELLSWIEGGGLKVLGRLDTKPKHPKSRDASDPLYEIRAKEITSLWRLVKSS